MELEKTRTGANMNYIPISIPSMDEREFEAVREPLSNGWLTQGPIVRAFEKEFAEKHDVKYALATTSCTTALHLMLITAGIGPGDEVIVPSFTWVATANAVLYVGATPILVDIEISSFNISQEKIIEKITSKTKAVIVVHLFGNPFDTEELKKNIPSTVKIFEDAACAAGASLNGKKIGSLGKAAAFSFHPRKSITTGEGGMITTNDEEFFRLAEQYRNHGARISEEERHLGPKPYLLPDFDLVGFNYRMTDVQAAIGRVQLQKLDSFVKEREDMAAFYSENLDEIEWIRLPKSDESNQHAWQAYVVRVEKPDTPNFRNNLMNYLHENKIATRPGTHAIHMLSIYKKIYQFQDSDFPVSKTAAENSMAIPLHNNLSKEQLKYIITKLKEFR